MAKEYRVMYCAEQMGVWILQTSGGYAVAAIVSGRHALGECVNVEQVVPQILGYQPFKASSRTPAQEIVTVWNI